MLVDTSGSVDENEYQLQQQGYVDAFRNDALIAQIERYGGIAVTYVEWSSADAPGRTHPVDASNDGHDCRNFAAQVDALERRVEGWTRLAPDARLRRGSAREQRLLLAASRDRRLG